MHNIRAWKVLNAVESHWDYAVLLSDFTAIMAVHGDAFMFKR